jgi:hypothetical protein
MTNYIWVTTQFEGFHHYFNAPEEVAFLRDTHRHIFHIKIWVEIFTNDRDIEFILFKKFIDNNIARGNMNDKSCEMIADDLNELIKTKYPNRKIKIEVSEDGENGCEKEYEQ